MKKTKNIKETENIEVTQKTEKKAQKIDKKAQKIDKKAPEMLLPKAYRPLSTWSYLGLTILYLIPVIGWIFLLAHAIDGKNRHGRTYARSWFCGLLTFSVIAAIGIAVAFALNWI